MLTQEYLDQIITIECKQCGDWIKKAEFNKNDGVCNYCREYNNILAKEYYAEKTAAITEEESEV